MSRSCALFDPSFAAKIWATRRRAVLARHHAAAVQQRALARLIAHAAGTRFGQAHDFSSIKTVQDYQSRTALRDYDAFWTEWWQPAFPRIGGVTWPGAIRYFASSSGTTQGRTKRIPLSDAMLRANGRAGLDVLAWHLSARPDSRVLGASSVFLGGTTSLEELAPGVRAGDLSGIAAIETPFWARGRVLPHGATAAITDWREKMARLAPEALARRITSISGTASWMLLFFETAAALRPPGARLLRDMFPDLELLVHGGVGFAPYRPRFADWMQGSAAVTREVYAASEGFIAVADRGDGEGLRLVLDRGLFYEFVRPADLASANPDRRWIANAELGEEYALILTTNSGLWSYVIGDTVRLVSLDPPRLLITGRTTWSLSVVGEHLISAELDQATSEAARASGRNLVEYSVAPIQPDAHDCRGGHLFAVELDGPADPREFARVLDAALIRLNEDYAAHRGDGFGLRDPDIRLLPPGSFLRWMERRQKLGAQNKVPRVVADADALSALLHPT
jgi:hypothetical protein